MRGVKIDVLRALKQEAIRRNDWNIHWSIARVNAEVIGSFEVLLPDCRFGPIDPASTLTFATRSSLLEAMKEDPLLLGLAYDDVVSEKANIFVCCAYGDNFIELTDSLESYLESNSYGFDESNTYFSIDLAVNDQWSCQSKDLEWW